MCRSVTKYVGSCSLAASALKRLSAYIYPYFQVLCFITGSIRNHYENKATRQQKRVKALVPFCTAIQTIAASCSSQPAPFDLQVMDEFIDNLLGGLNIRSWSPHGGSYFILQVEPSLSCRIAPVKSSLCGPSARTGWHWAIAQVSAITYSSTYPKHAGRGGQTWTGRYEASVSTDGTGWWSARGDFPYHLLRNWTGKCPVVFLWGSALYAFNYTPAITSASKILQLAHLTSHALHVLAWPR